MSEGASGATLRRWVAAGRVRAGTPLVERETGRTLLALDHPALLGAFDLPVVPSEAVRRRSTAAWLAFLLGPFGAHRLYLGHRRTGLAMLWFSVATCGAGTLLTGLVAAVDLVRILSGAERDAEGRALA